MNELPNGLLGEVAYLTNGYLRHELTAEETDRLLHLAQTEVLVREFLRQNVLADFFLAESGDLSIKRFELCCQLPEMSEDKFADPQESVPVFPDFTLEANVSTTIQMDLFDSPKESENRAWKMLKRFWIFSPKKEKEPKKTLLTQKKSVIPLVIRAVLFFGFLAWLSWEGTQQGMMSDEVPPFVSFARITETIDAVWEPNQPVYQRGQWLEPVVPLFLKSGYVKIVMDTGTELLLEGPTHMIPTDSKTVACSKGKINATVPKKGVGFEIVTSLGKVIDYGTAFALTIDEKENRLDVIEGQVGISVASVPEPRLFRKNESATLNQRLSIKPVPSEPSRFLTANRFLVMLKEYAGKIEKQRRVQELALDTHPNLLARFDFKNGYQGKVPNLAQRGQSLCPSLIPITCREGEGSLPGRYALQLRNQRSRGSFSVSGQYPSLTLCIRVRVDFLPNSANTLFASDSYPEEPGSMIWQILNTGELALLIKPGDGKSYQDFSSPSVFNRRMLGTWVDLAIVLDVQRRKITHYLNGRSVASIPWKEPIVPVLDHVSLGNHIGNYLGMTQRHLAGAVENFYLFDRALTSKEIADLTQ